MNPHRRTALLLLVGLGVAYAAAVGLSFSTVLARDAAGCSCMRSAAEVSAASFGRWFGGGTLVVLFAFGATVALRAGRAVQRSERAAYRSRLGRRTVAGVRVHVVPGDSPRAFCVGGLRPRIIVTAAFLRLESPEQRAVLAHERAHTRARDPLAFAVLEAAAILPLFRPLAGEYRRQAEFSADDAARTAAGDGAFASALARGLDAAPDGAASFSPTEARVRRFLGHPYATSRAPLVWMAIGLVAVLSVLLGSSLGTRRAVARETLWCVAGPVSCRGAAILKSQNSRSTAGVLCRSTADGTVCGAR